MLSILIFVFIISSFAFFACVRYDRRFEEVIPISAMGIVLFLFMAGMINGLKWGALLVTILSIAVFVYTIYWIVKNGGGSLLKQRAFNVITPATGVFLVLVVLISYWNRGRFAMVTDEFSHWLDTVVIMSQIDAFGTAPGSTAVFPSYPPAMSLFQYFLEKINIFVSGEFSEWKCYFAYQLFAVIIMLPFIKKEENWAKQLASVITFYMALIAPLYFFSQVYNSLYIDPILGVMGGCGFAMIALCKNKDWLYVTYITMLCAVLTLTKDVGIYLALFIALYFLIDYKKKHVITVAPFIALALAKMLWKLELTVSHTTQKFGEPFDVAGVIATLRGQGNDFYNAVYENFQNAITYRYVYYERVGFNYTALMVLILVALTFFNLRLYRKGTLTKASAIAGTVIPSGAITIYILSMFPLYVSRFSEQEALNLASFDRYCGIMFLTGLLLLIMLFRSFLIEEVKNIPLLILSVIIVLSVHHSQTDLIKFYTEKQSVEVSANYRAAVNNLAGIINANTDSDARILLVGNDEDQPMHPILATISKPRSFTFIDVYIPDTVDEAAGGMSLKDLRNIIVTDYDYVAVFRATENLLTNYRELFDGTEIKDIALYKVDADGNLTLVQ